MLRLFFQPQHCVASDPEPSRLLCLKGCTLRLTAVTGTAALDIHTICLTLIIIIIHTFHSFAINVDRAARMRKRACIAAVLLLCKALTTGILTALRVLSAHHDIALRASLLLIVAAVVHSTL